MVIILEYPHTIKHYIKSDQIEFEYDCPYCDRSLWSHGSYKRTVHHKSKSYDITIIRKRCPDCNKTFSFIPSFVRPWARFANHIREFFAQRVLAGIPVSHLPEVLTCVNTSVVSLKTLYRWKKQMGEFYQAWLVNQRNQAISDPSVEDQVLFFYRGGFVAYQECLFFLHLHFNARLPRRGHLISTINISLPTKQWW